MSVEWVRAIGSYGQPYEIISGPGKVFRGLGGDLFYKQCKDQTPTGCEPVDVGKEFRARRNICVVRMGELGDTVVTLVGLRFLKALFPEKSFALITGEAFRSLFTAQKDVLLVEGRNLQKAMRSAEILRVNLDGFYELDHHPDGARKSRLDQFLEVFGVCP